MNYFSWWLEKNRKAKSDDKHFLFLGLMAVVSLIEVFWDDDLKPFSIGYLSSVILMIPLCLEAFAEPIPLIIGIILSSAFLVWIPSAVIYCILVSIIDSYMEYRKEVKKK